MGFGLLNDEKCVCHMLSQEARDRGAICIGCFRRKQRESDVSRTSRLPRLGVNLIANWYTGPLILLIVFAAAKMIAGTQIEQWDLLWIIVFSVIWQRWAAEREFSYLNEMLRYLTAEIQAINKPPAME